MSGAIVNYCHGLFMSLFVIVMVFVSHDLSLSWLTFVKVMFFSCFMGIFFF